MRVLGIVRRSLVHYARDRRRFGKATHAIGRVRGLSLHAKARSPGPIVYLARGGSAAARDIDVTLIRDVKVTQLDLYSRYVTRSKECEAMAAVAVQPSDSDEPNALGGVLPRWVDGE